MSQPKQIDFSQPWSVDYELTSERWVLQNNGYDWAYSQERSGGIMHICDALNHLRALRSEIGSFLEQTKADREERVAKG